MTQGAPHPAHAPVCSQEAELERLEREFAIQSQITEAARRLASDPNVSKKLKKQRKTSYLNALKKLQEIENAINENRVKAGKKPTQRASLIIEGQYRSCRLNPQAPQQAHPPSRPHLNLSPTTGAQTHLSLSPATGAPTPTPPPQSEPHNRHTHTHTPTSV